MGGHSYTLYGGCNFDQPSEQSAMHWISRHDGAYNVLFPDGAVKTFSDSARLMHKVCANERVSNGGYPVNVDVLNGFWTEYFDPLYAQD